MEKRVFVQTRRIAKYSIAIWGDYTVGFANPNGIINHQIFVVVRDFFGNRKAKSGLRFGQQCLSYRCK